MGTIPVGKAETGDILLVTQHPTNSLSALIVELDRSPTRFSHAGVADDRGGILSSYIYTEASEPWDRGGLRHDPFEHWWDLRQDIYRLQLPADAHPEVVLEKLRLYPENRESSFAFVKTVIVAAALHALLPGNDISPAAEYEVVMRAIDAAEVWRSDDHFFCSEFVARLYDVPFTLGELRPPPRDEVTSLDFTRTFTTLGAALLTGLVSPERRRTLWALKRTIDRCDPAFFEEGVDVILGDPPSEDLHSGVARRREASRLDETKVVPAALVTPRMLENWGRGVDILQGSPSLRVET